MAHILRDQDAAELGDLPIAVEVMGDPDVQGSTTSFCDRGRWMGQSLADAAAAYRDADRPVLPP